MKSHQKKLITKGTASIYAVDDHYVVRELTVERIKENIPNTKLSDDSLVKLLTEKSLDCFKRIGKYDGINVVNFEYDSITNKPIVMLTTKAERVYGRSLFTLDLEKEVSYLDIIALIKGLSKYVKDVEQGLYKYVWVDLTLRQFMLGYTKKTKRQKIYLVDIDPIVIPFSQEVRDVLIYRLGNLINQVQNEYTKSANNFEKILEALPKISKKFNPEDLGHKYGII